MNRKSELKVPKIKRVKSLSNRIRFIVNFSIMIAIFLLCSMLIFVINQSINSVSENISLILIEEVQEVFKDLSIEAETLHLGEVTETELIELYRDDEYFEKRIGRELDRMIIFSSNIKIGDQEVFNIDANTILKALILEKRLYVNKEEQAVIENEMSMVENEINKSKLPKTMIESDLFDHNGNVIGSMTVGIDNTLEYTIYFAILVLVTFVGLIVIIIMRFVTILFVKPILKPIAKLQTQLEQLGDESYEDINPTVIVNKRAVKEVKDLSNATNKLLDKMISYNEVITQSEKMASVGQLTAAITHEINTPLGVINSNAGLMKMLAEEAVNTVDHEEKQMLLETMGETADTTEEACYRIQEIIKSLRSYSRIDQADFMPASINESMKSVVTLTTNLHKNRIEIIEEFGEIPDIPCYIGLINQVFMNLIINAIQAIEGEGKITLKTTTDGEYVYASVIDTGCGINKKNIYRIFEYGFTTKQPGSGSGIGLALSNNIIRKHNGEIIVDSREGEGAIMTVMLPISQEIK